MKCNFPECSEEARVHILQVEDRTVLCQKDFAKVTSGASDLCDPGAGITSIGSGLTGAINSFELCFIVFCDGREADSLYFKEIAGTSDSASCQQTSSFAPRRGSPKTEPVARRPFTFAAIRLILKA